MLKIECLNNINAKTSYVKPAWEIRKIAFLNRISHKKNLKKFKYRDENITAEMIVR